MNIRSILSALLIPFLLPISTFAQKEKSRTITESSREIPLAYDVDVVVVGGTTRGVAAAVAAAEQGARVFLAASRPYLGEDMCATYRLWLEEGEEPSSPLKTKKGSEKATNTDVLRPTPPLPTGRKVPRHRIAIPRAAASLRP